MLRGFFFYQEENFRAHTHFKEEKKGNQGPAVHSKVKVLITELNLLTQGSTFSLSPMYKMSQEAIHLCVWLPCKKKCFAEQSFRLISDIRRVKNKIPVNLRAWHVFKCPL